MKTRWSVSLPVLVAAAALVTGCMMTIDDQALGVFVGDVSAKHGSASVGASYKVQHEVNAALSADIRPMSS